MITRFRRPSFRSAILGLGLFGVLGWTAFTTAAAAPALTVGGGFFRGEVGEASDDFQVRVERQQEPETWRAELRQKLGVPRKVAFLNTPLDDVMEWVRSVADVNLVVDTDAGDMDNLTLTLRGDFLTPRQVLDIVTRTHEEFDWCLSRQAIYVGWRGNLPLSMDLRFYNVRSADSVRQRSRRL